MRERPFSLPLSKELWEIVAKRPRERFRVKDQRPEVPVVRSAGLAVWRAPLIDNSLSFFERFPYVCPEPGLVN